MGIDPAEITDRIRRLMDPNERKGLGKYGETTNEAITRRTRKLERRIHDDFVSFLRRHNLPFRHDNPTKASTGPVGYPDFFVGPRESRGFFIEFKCRPNRLTPEQADYIEFLRANGNLVIVAEEITEGSAYTVAIEATIKFFNL